MTLTKQENNSQERKKLKKYIHEVEKFNSVSEILKKELEEMDCIGDHIDIYYNCQGSYQLSHFPCKQTDLEYLGSYENISDFLNDELFEDLEKLYVSESDINIDYYDEYDGEYCCLLGDWAEPECFEDDKEGEIGVTIVIINEINTLPEDDFIMLQNSKYSYSVIQDILRSYYDFKYWELEGLKGDDLADWLYRIETDEEEGNI